MPASPRSVTLVFALAVLVVPSTARAGRHKMFVTSTMGSGDLSSWSEAGGSSGVAAGDAICRARATAAGLDNPTTYVAWLSTSTNDAFCRVAGFSGKKADDCGQAATPTAGPWMRTDGRPFALGLQELVAGAVLHPPYTDEMGTLVTASPAAVYTGTNADGTVSEYLSYVETCADWTSSADTSPPYSRWGVLGTTLVSWTASIHASCQYYLRLICFEPGTGDPLPPFEVPGARAFVTSVSGTGELGSWAEADGRIGLEAGDTICRHLARDAHLAAPDSFVAWLSVSGGANALDRLTLDGPWKRPDGVQIAADKSALAAPDQYHPALVSPLNVTETGAYVSGATYTGTAIATGHGSGSDCGAWLNGTSGANGDIGHPNDSRGFWTQLNAAATCEHSLRLYCFSNVVTDNTLLDDDFESGTTGAWTTTGP